MDYIKNCEEVLASDAVESNPDGLSQYEVSNPLLNDYKMPECAVRPKDSSELQKLIKAANEKGMGLVPVST